MLLCHVIGESLRQKEEISGNNAVKTDGTAHDKVVLKEKNV